MLLVRRGLTDRTPAVAKAANALLGAWFSALTAAAAAMPSTAPPPPSVDRDSGDAAMSPAGPDAHADGVEKPRQDPDGDPGEPAGLAPDLAPDQARELVPVLALLAALGPEAHEAEAEAALLALITGGALSPVRLASAGGCHGGLRRASDAPLLSAEEALLWRVLVEWLQARAP